MRRACPGTNVNVNTGGDDDDWETDADFEVSPLVSFRLSNHLVNTKGMSNYYSVLFQHKYCINVPIHVYGAAVGEI
jgi:hypothetical protein